MAQLWPGPAPARAPEVTAEVLAKRTQFKSEVSWALKGFVNSPKKHFAFPELGLTIRWHILVPGQPKTLPQC